MAKELIYYPNPEIIKAPLFELNSLDEMPVSPKYALTCNGKSRIVYCTDFFHYAPVVVDEADGVDVEIVVSESFQEVKVRPSSYGIRPVVEGNKISFHLNSPQKVSVEIDGDLKSALFVLCSKRIPRPENTTICFERGNIYNVGTLELKTNDVVYIEEGAVVLGRVYANRADNIAIVGNGILCGTCWHKPDVNTWLFFIDLRWCRNVLLEGITAVDGPSWQIVPAACDHVVIRNVNSMSVIVTGDGMDLTGSQDVLVEDCFIRAADDCVCIKSGRAPDTTTVRDVKNILVQRCVIWNAEPGNGIEIGYGLQCKEVCDLTFRDCDIIHCEYEGNMGGSAISIHQADSAWIHDIHYEDIRVEDVAQKLFDIKVLDCKYTWDAVKGNVTDIYFKNIKVLNGPFPVSLISGYELRHTESRPHDIHFEDIEILGHKCESVLDMHMVVELAHDIYVNGKRECIHNKF